jgi:hypothetical protein
MTSSERPRAKAVMVRVACRPPLNSIATTWRSTASLSQSSQKKRQYALKHSNKP